MPSSSSEPPPINIYLSGTNAVIGGIPYELSSSPSSLAADDEQLTVRPHFTTFCLLANLFKLGSKPSATLMKANRSLYVRPCLDCLHQRSVYLRWVPVRNR